MSGREYNEGFTSQEDEHLTYLVAQHPTIYNQNIPDYKSSLKRDKVWELIAEELNKTSKDCKSRWKNIRDTYYRQKRKIKDGIGSTSHPTSKFETYRRLLSFLDTDSHEITSIKNDPENCDEYQSLTWVSPRSSDVVASLNADPAMSDSESNTINETQQNFTVRYKESSESLEPTLRPPQSMKKKGIKRSLQNQDDIDDHNHRNYSRQQFTQNVSSDKNSEDGDDEIDLFTRQANSILKKLPSYLQIKAMQEVFDTLTKYKMIAINSPSGSSGTMPYLASSLASESHSRSAPVVYHPQTPTSTANDSSSLNIEFSSVKSEENDHEEAADASEDSYVYRRK